LHAVPAAIALQPQAQVSRGFRRFRAADLDRLHVAVRIRPEQRDPLVLLPACRDRRANLYQSRLVRLQLNTKETQEAINQVGQFLHVFDAFSK
jgi:hypothetical protein